MPNTETNLWCNNLPFKERLKLSEAEAKELYKRMYTLQRKYQWSKRITEVVLWIAFLNMVSSIAFCVKNENKFLDIAGTTMAIAIFLPPLVGIIQEIIFGFNIWIRLISAPILAIASFMFYLSIGDAPKGFWEIVTIISFTLVFSAGWVLFIIRWLEGKDLKKPLNQAMLDAGNGEVFVFEGEIEKEEEIDQRDSNLEENQNLAASLIRIELLPNSSFLYRINKKLIRKLEILQPVSVSKTTALSSPMEFQNIPLGAPTEEFEYFQRSFTEEELTELKRISGRMLRLAFVHFLGAVWLFASIVRLIENFSSHRLEPGISGFGRMIVFGIGLIFWWRSFSTWLDLKSDIKKNIMVSTRKKGSTTQEVFGEFLLESKLIWSMEGKPMPWRTHWW